MKALTPLMQQYWEIKNSHLDKILFYRMGDFFELFYDDALIAAPLLGITLTQRNKKSMDETPMCGVPHHAIAGPINKLLQYGYKVAICDQLEDPKTTKGIVKRGVTRILTPGMVFDPDTLEASNYHFMACYHKEELACVDTTTGDAFYFSQVHLDQVKMFCEVTSIAEWVFIDPQEASTLGIKSFSQCPETDVIRHCQLSKKDFCFDPHLQNQPGALTARLILMEYIKSLTHQENDHLSSVKMYGNVLIRPFELRYFQKRLKMNPQVYRHLEIFESYLGNTKNSLYSVINKTLTPMGARLLKDWLNFPTNQIDVLQQRQQQMRSLLNDWGRVEEITSLLKSVGDIERKLTRTLQPQSNGRDLKQLAQSIRVGIDVLQKLHTIISFNQKELIILLNLTHHIEKTLVEDPPLTVKQGYLIRKGVNSDLDYLIDLSTNGQKLIQKMEEEERKKTQISSLKIRYNNVFGYYIEVTHVHQNKVPSHYIRKQTLSQVERFTTQELIELEKEILQAETKRFELEYQIFDQLRLSLFEHRQMILNLSRCLADIDVYGCGARLYQEENYRFVHFSSEDEIILKMSRHPVVEKSVSRFTPNDIMIRQGQVILITGPNMAGKSTLMRQVALNVLLAHIGFPVACQEGKLPLIDGIFTRIGASDFLSEGLSTFMVEMQETSLIIKNYGPRSLIVLDEIGRGTSTYDGLSLAQAILEHLIKKQWGFVLFATHYHELSNFELKYPQSLINKHMSIYEREGALEFLHSLKSGPAGKSYGLYVASLAGLPQSIIKTAEINLKYLEKEQYEKKQLSFPLNDQNFENDLNQSKQNIIANDLSPVYQFPKQQWEVFLDELKKININQLTPLEAINILDQMQKKVQVQGHH